MRACHPRWALVHEFLDGCKILVPWRRAFRIALRCARLRPLDRPSVLKGTRLWQIAFAVDEGSPEYPYPVGRGTDGHWNIACIVRANDRERPRARSGRAGAHDCEIVRVHVHQRHAVIPATGGRHADCHRPIFQVQPGLRIQGVVVGSGDELTLRGDQRALMLEGVDLDSIRTPRCALFCHLDEGRPQSHALRAATPRLACA